MPTRRDYTSGSYDTSSREETSYRAYDSVLQRTAAASDNVTLSEASDNNNRFSISGTTLYHSSMGKNVTTDTCIYIDASIKIKDSLDQLIDDFNNSNSDIALLSHPTISTFVPELQLWIKQRNYSYINANKFLDFLYNVKYDLNYRSHFQSGISIRKNTKFTNDFQKLVLSHMYFISDENNFDKIDQLMQDFVLNTYFNDKNIFLLSLQCLNSKAL
jgi:hypothetical protein